MEKIYAIRVGRQMNNSIQVNVKCEEKDIETIAMSLWSYHNEVGTFGSMPICCCYAEGDYCDLYDRNIVVLMDCM